VVRDYRLVCLVALIMLTLLLLEEGFGIWAGLPMILGGVGVLARWGLGPILVLFTLTFLQGLRRWFLTIPWSWPDESPVVLDLVVASLTLVYVIAAMRLLALQSHTIPPDPRRARKRMDIWLAGRWLLSKEATHRSLLEPPSGEVLEVLLSTPVFVLVAWLGWIRLSVQPVPDLLNVRQEMWRIMLLVWGGGIVLAAAYAFMGYLRGTQASREEGLLYLQDQVWSATRGEQRRINRWLQWARLRKQRKEEAK
jgi:hypothetical protein